MTIEAQLKNFILDHYGSVRAFCQQYNFPYSTVANIFNRGVGSLGLQTAANICDCLDIDVDGLARGLICLRGDISKCISVSEQELRFITSFRASSSEAKANILKELPTPSIGTFVPTGVVITENVFNSLNNQELTLLSLFRKLNPEAQELSLKNIELLSQNNPAPVKTVQAAAKGCGSLSTSPTTTKDFSVMEEEEDILPDQLNP